MRRDKIISLMLFCVTFAVFSRVLAADFVQWDDDVSVYQNPHMQGLDWGRLTWMFTDSSYAMRYKPLTWLTYALIYQASGLNPLGYHLINLLLHCIIVVLVFIVIRRLLTPTFVGQQTQTILPAAVGALLWAINPLRVEPVARVTDLTYELLLFFFLISLWCYLRGGDRKEEERGRSPMYWCSVVAFAFSMLAYPFAFAYGVVLLVIDWYPLRRFEGCAPWWRDARARRIILEKAPFLLIGGIIFTTFAARLNPMANWLGAELNQGANFFERAMQACYVWAYYLWKPWVPFHLSPVYTTLVDFNPNRWPFWLSAALVVGISLVLFWKKRQWPWALALWLCHLALLLPALGLTERPHYTTDRYDYLPGLVWGMIIAAALWRLSASRKLLTIGSAGIVVVAVFWGSLSIQQTRIWRNSETLFAHMLRELGNNSYRSNIYWQLGKYYAEHGRPDDAIQQCQASLRIKPSVLTYLLLAEIQERNGRVPEAVTNYLTAVQLRPDPEIHLTVGSLLYGLGRTGEAVAQYRQALKLSPDLLSAMNNLAWILATDANDGNRNGIEAVQLAERLCTITKRQVPSFLGTLAAAYAEAGRYNEAVETGQKARDMVAAAGEQQLAESYRKMIELYRSGKAYHLASPVAVK